MGAVCEDTTTKQFPNIQGNEEASKLSNYQKCHWPTTDAEFQDKIQSLKSKQDWKEFIEQHRLQKHKSIDQYYLGQWDIAGCQRGQGILYRPNDLFYYGSFDSFPHGNGVFDSLKYRFIYQGQFNHGRIQGRGRLQGYDQTYLFQGNINSQSKPTTGKLEVNNPQKGEFYSVYLDNYPVNKAKILYKDGKQYEGYINTATFMPQGYGTSIYPNHSKYEGNWKEGQFDGFGKFSWADGSQYAGDYVYGKKHGKGRFTYTSRKIYDGEWFNGKQSGSGVLFNHSGDVLKKGHWNDGTFDNNNH